MNLTHFMLGLAGVALVVILGSLLVQFEIYKWFFQ